jgi:hypothetical protein
MQGAGQQMLVPAQAGDAGGAAALLTSVVQEGVTRALAVM